VKRGLLVLILIVLAMGLSTSACSSKITPSPVLLLNNRDDFEKLSMDIVYPDNIIVTGYVPGFNIDKWLMNDNTPMLGHGSYDTMAIKIYNSENTTSEFSLQYADIVDKAFNSATGLTYSVAPKNAKDWLTISKSPISLAAHELASVPISFQMPDGASAPDNWEFRITVTNETIKTQISANQQVRFLVSMQPK